MDVGADYDAGKEPAEPAELEEPSSAKRVRIVCSNTARNIRVGNKYAVRPHHRREGRFRHQRVATVENGWHAVVVGVCVDWIFGK